MKNLLAAVFIFFPLIPFAQVAQYRAINATLYLTVSKNDDPYRFVNRNILVNLDYQTGNFLLKLSNTDLYQADSITNNGMPDTLTQQQYTFSGILPINEMIDQQATVQDYDIELQLNNDNLNIDQTINLDMTITIPNASGQANYRIFDLKGTLDNGQLQLPALLDFDNEIQFWIQFAGISTSN